jgi:hypothetical protein
MQMKSIMPARPGLRVRGPDGYILPAEGATVEWCSHWERRLIEGSVTIVTQPSAPPEALRQTAVKPEKSNA